MGDFSKHSFFQRNKPAALGIATLPCAVQAARYSQSQKRTEPGELSCRLMGMVTSSANDARTHTHLHTINPGNTTPQTSNNKKICPSGRNLEITYTQVPNTSRDQLSIVNNHCGPGSISRGQPLFSSSLLLLATKNTGRLHTSLFFQE